MKLPTTSIELLKLDNATIDQLLDMAIVPPSSELWMRGEIEEDGKDSRDLLRMMHMHFVRKLYALCVTSYEKAYLKNENVPIDQFDPAKPVSIGYFWELANSYVALGKYADAQAKINSCLEILESKANQHIDFNQAYRFNFFYKGDLPFTRLLLNLTLIKIHILQGEHNAAKELCEKIENNPDVVRDLEVLNQGGGAIDVLYLMSLEYSKLGLIEQAERRYAEFISKISELDVIENGVRWQQLNVMLEILKLYQNDEHKQGLLRNAAEELFSTLIKNISIPQYSTYDGSPIYINPNEILYYAIRAAQPPCNIEIARRFVENFPESYIDVLGDSDGDKARGLENLANFYAAQDMIDKSIEYYQISFNLYPRYYNNVNRYSPLASIASLYLKLGKFSEALAYLILTEESGLLSSIWLKYTQTQGLKQTSEVINDLLTAMDSVQLPDNRKIEESNLCTLAEWFAEMGNLEAARACYERATQEKYSPKGQSYYSLGMLEIEGGFIEQGISDLKKASDLGYIAAKYVLIEQYVTPPLIQEEEQQAQANGLMAVNLVKQLFASKDKNYAFYNDRLFYPAIQNLKNISIEGKLIFAMFLTRDSNIELNGPDLRDFDDEPGMYDGLKIFEEVIKDPGGKLYAGVMVEHLKTLDLKYGKDQLSAANIFVLAGRKDEARNLYMKIIDHEGGSELDTTANFMIGLILEEAGDFNQARAYYAEASKSYNSQNARIIFEHVELSEFSSCREGLLFLGKLYESIGDEDCIQEACNFYKLSAMASIKKQDGLTFSRALLHSMASRVVNRVTGYQDEAIVALRALADKQNLIAMFALGEIYEAQGDVPHASELYLKAAEKNNIPAMLKLAQLTKDDTVAMAWYWRAIEAGENDVAFSSIRTKFSNILDERDIEKLEHSNCLYDDIGADLIMDPVVIAYNVADNNPDAHYIGIAYERSVLKNEVKRQSEISAGNIFKDPKTQAITSIQLTQLGASNELLIPNKALSGLIRYKLENIKKTVATYPGFIDLSTGERFIEPWLTDDGVSVERGHPNAKVPNKNLKNIMLRFPVTGIDFLLRGVKQKNLANNEEALQCFLRALALAQPKQDLQTESLYPANAKLCSALFDHISKSIHLQIKHRENAEHEIMHEIMSRLRNVLAEKYDILIPMLTSNITDNLMFDPVIVSNGQLYDSYTINTWFAAENTTDPNTKDSILMNFIRSKGIAGIIPFLLLGGDIDSYPGFFNTKGERFREPYINTLGETVERGSPGAMYPNFWLKKIMEELKIPDRRPANVNQIKNKW